MFFAVKFNVTLLCRYILIILPFPKHHILDSSKLEEFADDNNKFNENSIKRSKWVENTEGKGEIARYKQVLLFPPWFQKTCPANQ